MTGYVYFIEAVGHRKVKIGWARSVTKRFHELQAQHPDLRLALKHVVSTATPRGLEAGFHQRFAHWRAEGEWFRYVPPLADLIGPPTEGDPVPETTNLGGTEP